ncbi:hypothetical protein KBTX_04501 [wastewater metagenome]|uniref:Uncharacterized protein n=2 Tax=unclassified sequences TaxID=12908 RepID=A0A5B8RLD6_9ZZZZ|nr:hypothetical protein KBTEX_04501 [uncultured organism]
MIKAFNVADFGENPGATNRTESRDAFKGVGNPVQNVGNGFIEILDLTLQVPNNFNGAP